MRQSQLHPQRERRRSATLSILMGATGHAYRGNDRTLLTLAIENETSLRWLDNSLISNYLLCMKTTHIVSLISRIRYRANRLLVRELRKRGINDLAPSHGDIISILFEVKTTSMTTLAGRINRDKSTMTALVKKLKALGYVETLDDPRDHRVTLVRLTEKGWDLKEQFDKISRILLDTVYQGLSQREREALVVGLERIERNL
jgi:DNA-binding MarR family transcriptional regulator